MKIFITLGLFLLLISPCFAEMVSVVHQPAELRTLPKVAKAETLRQLPRYAPLKVLDSTNDYFKVVDASGNTGYVHKALTGKMTTLEVTADVSNVRSGPGTEFPIVFKAVKGTGFKVLGKQGEWLEISGEDAQTGWIWQNLTWGY